MAICGTRASYVAGCRCPDCTEASRVYHRDHRWPVGRGLPRPARIPFAGHWLDQAACRGENLNLWFRDDLDGRGNYAAARQICAACPVRGECLGWALETNTIHGMFGGLSPSERRRHRRSAP